MLPASTRRSRRPVSPTSLIGFLRTRTGWPVSSRSDLARLDPSARPFMNDHASPGSNADVRSTPRHYTPMTGRPMRLVLSKPHRHVTCAFRDLHARLADMKPHESEYSMKEATPYGKT